MVLFFLTLINSTLGRYQSGEGLWQNGELPAPVAPTPHRQCCVTNAGGFSWVGTSENPVSPAGRNGELRNVKQTRGACVPTCTSCLQVQGEVLPRSALPVPVVSAPSEIPDLQRQRVLLLCWQNHACAGNASSKGTDNGQFPSQSL